MPANKLALPQAYTACERASSALPTTNAASWSKPLTKPCHEIARSTDEQRRRGHHLIIC